MCKNATKSAGQLMAAIEPTFVSLLNATGQSSTPNGIAAKNAYDAALTAVQNWVPGSKTQDVLQVVVDFQTALSGLPIPPNAQVFANIILAGLETVLAIISANSPAPATAAAGPQATPVAHMSMLRAASSEEVQAMHQASVIETTTAKVNTLVPGFQRSIYHSPESQYKAAWNKTVVEHPDVPVAKV